MLLLGVLSPPAGDITRCSDRFVGSPEVEAAETLPTL
jgi:hypothetical protein